MTEWLSSSDVSALSRIDPLRLFSHRQRDNSSLNDHPLPDVAVVSNVSQEDDHGPAVIFTAGEQALLVALYGLILILGLTFNSAIIWVILGE